MENGSSRLSYLMTISGINGRELANALHVDYSLVSKWKNNKRPLNRHSVHLKKIAEYFISLDSTNNDKLIFQVLRDYDPNLKVDSLEDLSNVLCNWLIEPVDNLNLSNYIYDKNTESNKYTSTYEVFLSNKGRRKAVIQFLDYALSLTEGQTILLISQDDMCWMTEDKAFLKLWESKLTQLLKKDHQIKIVHSVDRQIETLSNIIRQWLPLHMTGKIESYYYPKYSDFPLKTTLYIIKNHLAVVGFDADNTDKNNRYTSFFYDKVTVKQYTLIFEKLLGECRPLIESYLKKEFDKVPIRIFGSGIKKENSYLYADVPMFLTMSEELLIEVLTKNMIKTETINQCIFYHQQINSNFKNNIITTINRHIYDLDKLEKLACQDNVIYNELSYITGKKISVSKELFNRHIELLIARLNDYSNFEIALTSSTEEEQLVKVNFWIKQNKLLTAWPVDEINLVAFAKESTIINAFYHYYDAIWNSIPRVNRNHEFVKAKLLNLIK